MGCVSKHGFKLTQMGKVAFNDAGDQLSFKKSNNDKIIGISLKNGSFKEINLALCLVAENEWEELYCQGKEDFLSTVANKLIPDHLKSYPSLKRMTVKFNKDGIGFGDSDDWTPLLPHTPKSHDDNGQDHSGPRM